MPRDDGGLLRVLPSSLVFSHSPAIVLRLLAPEELFRVSLIHSARFFFLLAVIFAVVWRSRARRVLTPGDDESCNALSPTPRRRIRGHSGDERSPPRLSK